MGDGRTSMTRSGLSLVIAALLLQAPSVRAAQLDKDSCSKLKSEQAQLEQGGARSSLGKGPEWAKANLAPDKLELICRLIEVDEQLLFRCAGRPLVVLPNDPDPAARAVQGKDGAKGGPPAAAPKAPAGQKKKAVPPKKAAAPRVEPQALELGKEAPPPATVSQPAAAPVTPAPPLVKEAAKEAPPPATIPQPVVAPVTPAPPPVKEAATPTPPASEPAAAPAPPPVSAKAEEDKKAAAIKAARAKARKKAAEAYSPQAPDWASNPFAATKK